MMANTCLNVKHKIKMNNCSKIQFPYFVISGFQLLWLKAMISLEHQRQQTHNIKCIRKILFSVHCQNCVDTSKGEIKTKYESSGLIYACHQLEVCFEFLIVITSVPHYYFFFPTFNTIPSILANSFNLSGKFFLVTHHNNVVKIWGTLKTWRIFNEKCV